ncbi:MAG: hypothetical protein K2K72_08170 [Duncaniella sp.]|nr:hypothetical protein [Duncaniella sp.]
MKPLSIEPVFMPATTDASVVQAIRSRIRKARTAAEQFMILVDESFDSAYDLLRLSAADHVARGEADKLIAVLEGLLNNSPASGDEATPTQVDIYSAILQILTAMLLELDRLDEAAAAAARLLTHLSQQPRRKDTPFLQLLGALLYDLAYLHCERGEYKQAERDIEKAIKIFERLSRLNPGRYASAQVMSINGATTVYRNRERQTQLLAQYQAATTMCMEMVKAGVDGAAKRLTESLESEGKTLASMGKHREAIQYYSRALKYLAKFETEFSLNQLRLSILLGESMLALAPMREKGVHLLNTMLHKATKINALEEHRRIVDSLYHARSRSLDILGFWHKLFPK